MLLPVLTICLLVLTLARDSGRPLSTDYIMSIKLPPPISELSQKHTTKHTRAVSHSKTTPIAAQVARREQLDPELGLLEVDASAKAIRDWDSHRGNVGVFHGPFSLENDALSNSKGASLLETGMKNQNPLDLPFDSDMRPPSDPPALRPFLGDRVPMYKSDPLPRNQ